MIEMHKTRQAKMQGFLAWLEREIGAPVDGPDGGGDQDRTGGLDGPGAGIG